MLQLSKLKGIGKKIVERLNQTLIFTPLDLLLFLPRSYQDRTQLSNIDQLISGEFAQITGSIHAVKVNYHSRRKIISCEIKDGTGSLVFKLFNFYPNQIHSLAVGRKILLYGQVRINAYLPEMVHPEWKIIPSAHVALEKCLTPIYSTISGIGSKRIHSYIQQLLHTDNLSSIQDLMPQKYKRQYDLVALDEALQFLHFPPQGVDSLKLQQGKYKQQKTIIFEELLAHCLSSQKVKVQYQNQIVYPVKKITLSLNKFLDNLDFSLTKSQVKVMTEIHQDLFKAKYLSRLIQGDVGSGKTIIAAVTILPILDNGYQAILMAPTEILADQHFAKFQHWFAPLGFKVTLLISKQTVKIRKQNLSDIKSGKAQLIIGTHALFQKEVKYHKIALIVIDEQHRFGVEQRLDLMKKGHEDQIAPHQLIMTATPIPRTLAMTVYGDLNISTITELPPGRKVIKTVVMSNAREEEIINRLEQHCSKKGQAYWVCSLIESSETEATEHLGSAEDRYAVLSKKLCNLKIGLIHGRMSPEQKSDIMFEFKQGNINILVATTVIEVGVDVPNASIMIIENPERLGLSQLHQLRGRVGRGDIASSCVLMYHQPLSNDTRERLEILRATNDGFKLAERDLELRGPGDFLGKNQTGSISFKIANLIRDQYLIDQIQKVAAELYQDDKLTAEKIMLRWHKHSFDYSKV